jgi:hypothetical protein
LGGGHWPPLFVCAERETEAIQGMMSPVGNADVAFDLFYCKVTIILYHHGLFTETIYYQT